MKKLFYLVAIATIVVLMGSCSKNDNADLNSIETRATMLGYPDVKSYQAGVAIQCAAGNHENCCILADGTHQVCGDCTHSGVYQNGNRHNGKGKGQGGQGNKYHYNASTCTNTCPNGCKP